MLKFIIGFILGIIVASSGFSFKDLAGYLDQGVEYVKEASAQSEEKIEKKVDKP
jgi:hypothetical protein